MDIHRGLGGGSVGRSEEQEEGTEAIRFFGFLIGRRGMSTISRFPLLFLLSARFSRRISKNVVVVVSVEHASFVSLHWPKS